MKDFNAFDLNDYFTIKTNTVTTLYNDNSAF